MIENADSFVERRDKTCVVAASAELREQMQREIGRDNPDIIVVSPRQMLAGYRFGSAIITERTYIETMRTERGRQWIADLKLRFSGPKGRLLIVG